MGRSGKAISSDHDGLSSCKAVLLSETSDNLKVRIGFIEFSFVLFNFSLDNLEDVAYDYDHNDHCDDEVPQLW